MIALSVPNIELEYPPSFIHVKIPNADPTEFLNMTLIPGEVIIPVKLQQAETYSVQFPASTRKVELSCKPHAVQMGFALTAHKMQGQTVYHPQILLADLESMLEQIWHMLSVPECNFLTKFISQEHSKTKKLLLA